MSSGTEGSFLEEKTPAKRAKASQTLVEDGIIRDLHTFQNAIAQAQLNRIPYIEVDEKVFTFYTKGQPGKSFTYGNPGIRVYLAGCKEECDAEEARTGGF